VKGGKVNNGGHGRRRRRRRGRVRRLGELGKKKKAKAKAKAQKAKGKTRLTQSLPGFFEQFLLKKEEEKARSVKLGPSMEGRSPLEKENRR